VNTFDEYHYGTRATALKYISSLRALSPNKGKIMANDMEDIGTVELVSSEVSGYLNKDGQFEYGTPPAAEEAKPEAFVQSDEDAIRG
jgi:hypothetical protein